MFNFFIELRFSPSAGKQKKLAKATTASLNTNITSTTTDGTITTITDTPPEEKVNFVLMIKRNNKQIVKDLNIPMTSHLAANMRHKQLAEQAEHEEMKRLVLDYNQRQEEESYNG